MEQHMILVLFVLSGILPVVFLLRQNLSTLSLNIPDCFGVSCQNGGSLNTDSCRCDCANGWRGYECEKPPIIHNWPNDNFAIPEHIFGCPQKQPNVWKEISIHFQPVDDAVPVWKNNWPELPHFRGPLDLRSWYLRLCFMQQRAGVGQKPPTWPSGQYCVYKAAPCPSNMYNDTIIVSGYQLVDNPEPVPDFISVHPPASSISLSLCCKNENRPSRWPTEYSFILIKPGGRSVCTDIVGMETTEEWYKFPASTSGQLASNRQLDTGHLQLEFCVYSPWVRAECGYSRDKFGSYRGRTNITETGEVCLDWEKISSLASSRYRTKNYCRKHLYADTPMCYYEKSSRVQWKPCNITECEQKSVDQQYRIIATHSPFDTNLKLAEQEVPISLLELFKQNYIYGGLEWVRVHLPARYIVTGLFISKESEETIPYALYNIAVWVHEHPDEFKNFGGHLCSEIEGLLEFKALLITCSHYLIGRYVTIESFTSGLPENERSQPEDYIFYTEYIELFGSVLSCGQMFHEFRAFEDIQITTSDDSLTFKQLHFLEPEWGCIDGVSFEVNIDLLYVTTIEGVALQLRGTDRVTLTLATWSKVDDHLNYNQTFNLNLTDNQTLYTEMLPGPTVARLVSVTFSNFREHLCLKLDLVGCPKAVNKDPFCSTKSTYVGNVSNVRSVRDVAVNRKFCQQNIGLPEMSDCSRACDDDDRCLLWEFDPEKNSCTLHVCPPNVDFNLINFVSSAAPLSKTGQTVVGEKVCVKDVITPSQCGYTVEASRDQTVFISSPNYPNFYGNNLDCEWQIHFKEANGVTVTLIDVDLARSTETEASSGYTWTPHSDTLWLHDGSPVYGNGFHTVLDAEIAPRFIHVDLHFGHFSGYFTNDRNSFIVRLMSGKWPQNMSARGFLVKLRGSECSACKEDQTSGNGEMKSCHGTTCGYITSMFYNIFNIDRHVQECSWRLDVASAIKFQMMFFEPNGCSISYLSIYAGGGQGSTSFDDNGWEEVFNFCQNDYPDIVHYVNSPLAGFQYRSEGEVVWTGLVLYWTAEQEQFEPILLNYMTDVLHYRKLLTNLGFDANDPVLLSYFQRDFCQQPSISMSYKIFDNFHQDKCVIFGGFTTSQRECDKIDGSWIELREKDDIRFLHSLERKGMVRLGITRNATTDRLYKTDGAPPAYIAWGTNPATKKTEPDGALYDTCVFINTAAGALPSDYTLIASPCSNDAPRVFICERDITLPWEDDGIDIESTIRRPMLRTHNATWNSNVTTIETSRIFRCTSGERIISLFRCDGRPHCSDGSDEVDCGDIQCGPRSFSCGPDQPCINLELTCDFYIDCPDGSDESDCVFPDCGLYEWRCNNGQCIDLSARMDKAQDCVDRSDEVLEGEVFNTFTVANPSNLPLDRIILTVYDENGPLPEISADNRLPERGQFSFKLRTENPVMIKLKTIEPTNEMWEFQEMFLLPGNGYNPVEFDCYCVFPDPATPKIQQMFLSMIDQKTRQDVRPRSTYIVTVVSKTNGLPPENKFFINLVGQDLDSGPMELDGLQAKGDAEEFTIPLIYLGPISMVKAYFYGWNFDEILTVMSITVHENLNNRTTLFNNVTEIVLDRNLTNLEHKFTTTGDVILPRYIKDRRCPVGMLQCVDGTCVPLDHICDRVTHCPGPFHEDEPPGCYLLTTPIYCDQYMGKDGLKEDMYNIFFGNFDNGPQYCFYDQDEHMIRSELRNRRRSVTYGGRTTYKYKLQTTSIKRLHIQRLSDECYMTVTVKCSMTLTENMLERIHWTSTNARVEYSLYDEQHIISCLNNKTRPLNGCNCLKTPEEWLAVPYREYLTDTFVIRDVNMLPIVYLHVLQDPRDSLNAEANNLLCYKKKAPPINMCRNGQMSDPSLTCLYQYDRYGRVTGCTDLSHLENCEDFECPEGFVTCHKGYCLPDYLVCNGEKECTSGEDEISCENRTDFCHNRFRCRGTNICISQIYVCNGRKDCPLNDDELFCNVHESRILVFRKSIQNVDAVFQNHMRSTLAFLDMSNMAIEELNEYWFTGMYNLLTLDLRNNNIKEIPDAIFRHLNRLRTLNLEGNAQLSKIASGAFVGVSSLTHLSLIKMKIVTIYDNTFDGLHSLQVLNLSMNRIETIERNAFAGLVALTKLDLRDNPITSYTKEIFSDMDVLKYLWSDLHQLCCIRPSSVTVENCLPTENEFSSCTDLMRNEILRSFLWIIGTIALLGNMLAMLYRFIYERRSLQLGHGVLVSNLIGADFIMGLYLVIVASADTHFRGRYIWNDFAWRNSPLCKTAGFLAFVSVEASSGLLCLITVDRLLTFRFTLERRNFTRNSALIACACVWIISVILAALPLTLRDVFDKEFYTKDGVCLAVPLTRQNFAGRDYATAIFVFLNFIMFALIAVGQLQIFREIRRATMRSTAKSKRDELVIARKLLLVVMTNFMCLFLISILGLMSMAGIVFNHEVYAWVAVFVLPLNSATNPVLYTLSSIMDPAFVARLLQMLGLRRPDKDMSETDDRGKVQMIYDRGMFALSNQPDMVSLAEHLENHVLGLRNVVFIARSLAKTMNFLHKLGYIVGPHSAREVLLKLDNNGLVTKICMVAMPVRCEFAEECANDVGNLGLLIKNMARFPRTLKIVTKKRRKSFMPFL